MGFPGVSTVRLRKWNFREVHQSRQRLLPQRRVPAKQTCLFDCSGSNPEGGREPVGWHYDLSAPTRTVTQINNFFPIPKMGQAPTAPKASIISQQTKFGNLQNGLVQNGLAGFVRTLG
jgi:hypothetical protein